MHYRKTSPLLLGAALLTAVSCEQYGTGQLQFKSMNNNTAPEELPKEVRGELPTEFSTGLPTEQPVDEGLGEHGDGHFKAVLWTLNRKVEGNSSMGDAELIVKNGQLMVEIKIQGAPADIIHVQHIHSADKCPSQESDVNNDGYVDVVEGIPSYGPILLSLDGNLENHADGEDGFPMADAMGSYFYTQSGMLDRIIEDLSGEDRAEDPVLTQLQGSLELSGKTIVIHGVPEDLELPETVQSIKDLPANATLPIACGEIRAATEMPGK